MERVNATISVSMIATNTVKRLHCHRNNEPEVPSLLAPFLAAGYTQPGEK